MKRVFRASIFDRHKLGHFVHVGSRAEQIITPIHFTVNSNTFDWLEPVQMSVGAAKYAQIDIVDVIRAPSR